MNLYKKTIPFVLMGASSFFNFNSANAQALGPITNPDVDLGKVIQFGENLVARASAMAEYIVDNQVTNARLLAKAENLRATYMDNVLAAQSKIAPYRGTQKYRSTVRRELPGAPVGNHCMYGQYTQLMRALDETGDTLTIVPKTGQSACAEFKRQMRSKYRGAEYAGCIKEGRVFQSDSAYNVALNNYLASRGITDKTPADKRAMAEGDFMAHNFSAEQIKPGSIWIVPRPNVRGKFHAVMFLGRGHIEDGRFVESPDGTYMYAGFNSERIGDMFATYNTSNVFSADIEKIARVDYDKELKRLESLPVDQMIEYIIEGTTMRASDLRALSHADLVRLVRDKYFGDDVNPDYGITDAAIAKNNLQNFVMQQNLQHTI